MSIVVATKNRKKLAEIRQLLADLPVEVVCSADALGHVPTVAEDGASFEENARKKAHAIAAATILLTLADDSGLEVAALGGQPGVRSARYASEGATDAENNAALLARMKDLDEAERSACFRCAVALVDPWNAEHETVTQGECHGRIAHKPMGTGGFGYDPLFLVNGRDHTMAELSETEKNLISHRARALLAMRPRIERIVLLRIAEARPFLDGHGFAGPSFDAR